MVSLRRVVGQPRPRAAGGASLGAGSNDPFAASALHGPLHRSASGGRVLQAVAGATCLIACSGGGKDGTGQSRSGHDSPVATISPATADSAEGPGAAPVPSDEPLVEQQPTDPGAGCTRVVDFEAVVLSTPPPFDVVIVADNSGSLSWSREDLASGLSDLVTNVYGHDVRFFVLSTTQYGQSSEEAFQWHDGEPIVGWRDPASLEPYTDPVTRYVVDCQDALGQPMACPRYPPPQQEFSLRGRWEFQMPQPVGTLTAQMTPAELDAEKDRVVEHILALGTTGSPQEQPLCTLARYIKQSPELLPERVAFIVISDEDDTASQGDCLAEYHYSLAPSQHYETDYSCTEDCDGYQFAMTRNIARNTLRFDCVPADDLGMLSAEGAQYDQSVAVSESQTCENGPTQPCRGVEERRAQIECGSLTVQNCQKLCEEGGLQRRCTVNLEDAAADLCAGESFSWAQEEYESFTSFCEQRFPTVGEGWANCQRRGFTSDLGELELFASYGATGVYGHLDTLGMVRQFQHQAERAFGVDDFFVESIVFDPAFDCEPQTGQSYATDLRNISSSPAHVYPICESYAAALDRVDQFGERLLQTQYPLTLGARESILSVTVQSRDGSTRQLRPGDYSHDPDASLLRLEANAIESMDSGLSIEVVDPCVPMAK